MTLGGLLNFIRKSQYFSADEFNKLVQETHEQVPPIKGETIERRIVLDSEVKTRTENTTTSGSLETAVESMEKGSIPFLRKRPETVKSDPLVYNTTGTLTFPGDSTTKFGGGAQFDGSSYILIDNHSILNVTDEISFGGWLKPTAFDGSTDAWLDKQSQYGMHFNASANQIDGFVFISSSGTPVVTTTYTPGEWVHLFLTWKSPTLKLYKNGVEVDSDTRSGTLDTGSLKFGIGARYDGTRIARNGTEMSHITVLHKEVSATWVSNHYNGLQDTSDGNDEIFSIPFVASDDPKCDATSGECRST